MISLVALSGTDSDFAVRLVRVVVTWRRDPSFRGRVVLYEAFALFFPVAVARRGVLCLIEGSVGLISMR